jgi:hypothetical protein
VVGRSWARRRIHCSVRNDATVTVPAGAVSSERTLRVGGDGFEIATGSPGGMPASSLPAGDRVDVVVGDGVELVICALHDGGHRPMLSGPLR